jgi:hypothetical protein
VWTPEIWLARHFGERLYQRVMNWRFCADCNFVWGFNIRMLDVSVSIIFRIGRSAAWTVNKPTPFTSACRGYWRWPASSEGPASPNFCPLFHDRFPISQQVGTSLELFEDTVRLCFIRLLVSYFFALNIFKKSERRASFIYFILFNLQAGSKSWVRIAQAEFLGEIRHARPSLPEQSGRPGICAFHLLTGCIASYGPWVHLIESLSIWRIDWRRGAAYDLRVA